MMIKHFKIFLLLGLGTITFDAIPIGNNLAGYQLADALTQGLVQAHERIYGPIMKAERHEPGFFFQLLDVPLRLISNIRYRVAMGELTPQEAMNKIGEIIMPVASGAITITSEFTTRVLIPNAAKIAAIGVGSYALKLGFDVLKAYITMLMNQPKLVRQILQPSQITQSFKDLYYKQETRDEIVAVIDMAKHVAANPSRARFENIMLWGDPGTGKTALVEIIAKEAGMTLYKTSGGDFAKLEGKDLEQIDKMFDSARKNRGLVYKRRVIIFIDEMEQLFGSRARENLSETALNVLAKIMVELSSPSSEILFIGATNRPQDLDEAMHRRMPQQIEVGLPDRDGRKAVFGLYVRKAFMDDMQYSASQKKEIAALFTDTFLAALADAVGDIAPAEIEDVMNRVKNKSLIYNKGMPTQKIIDDVIQLKLKQLKARQEGFVRASDKAKVAAQAA